MTDQISDSFSDAAPKPWWQSNAVLGGVAVVASQLAALAGYQLDAPAIIDIGTSLIGLFGGAMAIWGRIKAVQPIRR